jgi:hypothetical protein
MLERFTRERQRASKAVAFNLEEEVDLTHYGQSLSKFDDFDNTGLTLDDEEDDVLGAYLTRWMDACLLTLHCRSNRQQYGQALSLRWLRR